MRIFNKYRNFLAVLVGIGVAVGAYALRAGYLKKQILIVAPEGKVTMHLGNVPEARLTDPLTGKDARLVPIAANSHRLLLFLSAADCSSCLRIVSEIYALPRRVPQTKLKIEVIFVRSSSDEVKEYLSGLGRNGGLTLYLDSSRDIETRVALPARTPVAVVVDPNFNVVLVEPATTSEEDQKKFVDLVVQLTAKEK
jgi:hypothetical protein